MPTSTQSPPRTLTQRAFRGLDLYNPPHNMPMEALLVADNVLIYGTEAVQRPGKQGVWTSAIAGNPALYGGCEYRKSDGTTNVMFAAATGKLYHWVKGASAPVEILLNGSTSFTLSTNVVMRRIGKYVYIVDGVGPLYRVNINTDNSYTAQAVTSLTAPTSAPAASLSNTILDATTSTTNWSTFPALSSTAELISNKGFLGASTLSTDPPPYGWQTGGDTMDFTSAPFGITSTFAALFDSGAGPSYVDWEAFLPTYASNTITAARVFVVKTLDGPSGSYHVQMIPAKPVSPAVVHTVTDLVVGTPATHVSSATYTFVAGDAGKVLLISAGTNFTLQQYTIRSVTGGAAVLDQNAGTIGATAGTATLGLDPTDPSKWGHLDTILDSPPSRIVGAQQDTAINAGGNGTARTNVFSFTGLASEPTHMRMRLFGPASNVQMHVAQPSMQPVDVRINVALDSSGTGLRLSANNPLGYGANCLGGVWIKRDFSTQAYTDLAISGANTSKATSAAHPFTSADVGRHMVITAGTNWSAGVRRTVLTVVANVATFDGALATNTGATAGSGTMLDTPDLSISNAIAIGYTAPATSPEIKFRLGFQAVGAAIGSIAWSNVSALVTDSSGTYLKFDVSTVATTTKQQAQYLYLQVVADLPSTIDPANLCTVGPIVQAGNATVGGADYLFQYTEVNDTRYDTSGASTGITTDGQIESDPSPPSSFLTPTAEKAQFTIVFPALANASANEYYLYESGGTFDDQTALPTARLVAILPSWTDTIDTTSPGSGFVTWNHTTRTAVVNVSDLQLFGATTLTTGRGAPPSGATCVCEFMGRVALSVGSTLYLSWLITSGQAAALYYNTVNIPGDPYGGIKGGVFPAGGLDYDNIIGLKAIGPVLACLKGKSLYELTGVDGTDFQMFGHIQEGGVGLLALRGYALVENRIWLLGPNGVYEYDGGDEINPVSHAIEPLLNPSQQNGAAISATAYAKAAAIYHGKRFYLFAPVAGGSVNSVAWVWDRRNGPDGAWTRFTGMNITSAVSLSSQADTDDLYLFGDDGMLYQLTGNGDKTASGASATAVTWTVKSRGFGQESSDLDFWSTNRPTRAFAKITTQESCSVTLTVGAIGTTNTFATAETFNGTAVGFQNKYVTRDVEGDSVTVQVSGATITQSKVTALGATMAEGRLSKS